MKKRFLAGAMAGAMMLGGVASAFAEYVIDVPTSKYAGDVLPSEAHDEENLENVKGEIEDLISRGVSSSGSSASGIDLSGMSYEELVALHSEVVSAIAESDGAVSFRAEIGEYVVGSDIPVGDYSVAVDGEWDFCILNVKNTSGKLRMVEDFRSVDSKRVGRVSLVEGEVVEIEGGAFRFGPPSGITFD